MTARPASMMAPPATNPARPARSPATSPAHQLHKDRPNSYRGGGPATPATMTAAIPAKTYNLSCNDKRSTTATPATMIAPLLQWMHRPPHEVTPAAMTAEDISTITTTTHANVQAATATMTAAPATIQLPS